MNKKDTPLVSVIMATFNEPDIYISKSIESILNQTYSHLELLIADDSTDQQTINIIDYYAKTDNRVKIIRKEFRMGFVPALNYALQEAKGVYIARMDGDDISLPYRIETQVNYLIKKPKKVLVASASYIIDNKDMIVTRTFPPISSTFMKMELLRGSNPVTHPSVMINTNVAGSFSYKEVKAAEDYLLWLSLLSKGGIGIIHKPLVKYRILVSSLSHKIDNQNFYYFILMLLVKKFSLQDEISDKEICAYNTIYEVLRNQKFSNHSEEIINKGNHFDKYYNLLLKIIPERILVYIFSIMIFIKHFFVGKWEKQLVNVINKKTKR